MDTTCEQPAKEEKNLILSLPREKGWASPNMLYLFQDFWFPSMFMQSVQNSQKYFQAKDNDVIVASFPKSGTTWLRALTFAIVNHKRFPSLENHPLLTSNPHDLVPSLELIFCNDIIHGQIPQLSNMADSRRILGTHIPFSSVPKSIKETNCRIIYICRNPFDTFISSWIFYNKIKPESLHALTIEEAFDRYCKGILRYGPWWNHMLGYWKESLATPNKVLFLKYEDLKEDVNSHMKKVAMFLGCPFTQEEDRNRVIDSVAELCSFQKMRDLEVNKFGIKDFKKIKVEHKFFFRKAEIGDWVNYFSPSMIEKLANVIEEKLSGSGLSFKMHS